MKCLLLFLSCLFIKAAISQDVYPLHPSVGDSIDLEEKLDYSLFPKIDNNGFEYATIQFEDDMFKLVVFVKYNDKETGLEMETTYQEVLTQEEIIEEQQKIQKVNAYYRYLAEEEKKPKTNTTQPSPKSVPIRLEGPMSEKMKKEARMSTRLKEDSRRAQEFEMGLRPRELRIEFK